MPHDDRKIDDKATSQEMSRIVGKHQKIRNGKENESSILSSKEA